MVAVICDSRGAPRGSTFFQSELTRLNDSGYHVNVMSIPGAKFERVCRKANEYVRNNQDDVTYIIAGANDITTKHGMPNTYGRKYYTFDWEQPDHFAKDVIDIITKNMDFLCSLHPTQRIILCPIVGMRLDKTTVNATQQRQDCVNIGIWKINQAIFHINRKNKTSMPWLTRTVHLSHKSNGKEVDYANWMDDGLHPNDKLLTYWADLLVKHIKAVKTKIVTKGYTPV